jgi:helicase
MRVVPGHASLLHEEWIAGPRGASRASEVLGSLGVPVVGTGSNDEWAHKEAYSAILRAAILFELGRGVSASELERRWSVTGLDGVEGRWRDERLWLLAGLTQILDLRCFYFHLCEECEADGERITRVKELLLRMRTQVFELQERLKYCSPLGPLVRDIRRTQSADVPSIRLQSVRRLEEAGIRSLDDLAPLQVNDLVRLGVRRDLAEQIRSFVHRCL